MNRQKKQVIVAAVFLLLAGLVYVLIINRPAKVEPVTEKEKILTFEADSLEKLEFYGETEELSFEKKDGVWILKGYEDRTVDESMLKYAINCCINLSVERKIEDVSDYGQYGFDDPVKTVSFSVGGEDHTLIYGAYNSNGSVYYLMADDDPSVYVYSKSSSTALDNDAEYFLEELPQEETEGSDGGGSETE